MNKPQTIAVGGKPSEELLLINLSGQIVGVSKIVRDITSLDIAVAIDHRLNIVGVGQ